MHNQQSSSTKSIRKTLQSARRSTEFRISAPRHLLGLIKEGKSVGLGSSQLYEIPNFHTKRVLERYGDVDKDEDMFWAQMPMLN